MTDYLEEHLERADALLEQIRQMERGDVSLYREYGQETENNDGAGMFGGDSGGNEEPEAEDSEQKNTVDDLKRRVDQMEKTAYNLQTALETPGEGLEEIVNRVDREGNNPPGTGGRPEEAEQQEGAEAGSEESRTNEEKAAKNSSPLAARLEELDRAVSALGAGAPERQSAPLAFQAGGRNPAGYPGIVGTAGQSWVGEGRGALPLSVSGEELSWAEQADRVFRRDSRRYDGGFYLY